MAVARIFQIEDLESRRLLAVDTAVTELEWAGETAPALTGRWIVQLDAMSGTARRQLSEARTAARYAAPLARISRQLGQDGLFAVGLPTQWSVEQSVEYLHRLPGVVFAQPDFVYETASVPDDPKFSSQWSLHNAGYPQGTLDADIDAPEAWDLANGTGVVVAMIDTGIDYTHPDLAANVWTNPFEIPGNGIDDEGNGYIDDYYGWDFWYNDNDPRDENGHGTHTAGIVAAVGNNGIGISGVAPAAKVMALKIGWSGNSVTTSGGVAATNYARWMRNHGVNVRVLNYSWGGYNFDQAMYNAISAAGGSDMLVAAGAGNGPGGGAGTNNNSLPFYPASYNLPNVISVANLTRWDELATTSNYGSTTVHVGAPGTEIISTWPGNNYLQNSGTSMAAPIVSGIAALVFSANQAVTYQQVRAAIVNTTDPVAALAGKTVTGGRVNAFNAVQAVATGLGIPDLLPSSDSGVSATDNITNIPTLSLTGKAPANVTVQVLANGVLVGSTTADSAGVWATTTTPLSDGLRYITASAVIGGVTRQSPALAVWVDRSPPVLAKPARFVFEAAPHQLQFEFNEDVGSSLSTADLSVENLTAPDASPGSLALSYSAFARLATFTFPNLNNGVLKNGQYLATISSSGVTDLAGNTFAGATFPFFFLHADGNHDGRVDISDIAIIATNWARNPATFVTGDFNYSGAVEIGDLAELATYWNMALLPPTGQHASSGGPPTTAFAPPSDNLREWLDAITALGLD